MLHISPVLTAYLLLMAGLIGLVMGSFCNAWAWRLANGESIVHGRSHCAKCGHTLSPLDLVPLFSWLFLKGKCRYCHEPISPRYPAVELISCLYYVSIVWRFDLTWDCLRFLILGSLLLVAALVDLDTMELPDGLQIAAACAALLRYPAEGLRGMVSGLIGGAVILGGMMLLVLIADKVLGRESMGGGDIKLMAVFGLHFGLLQTLFLLVVASILGLLFAAITRRARGVEFPFGPALVVGGWIIALAGSPFIHWYLSLL